MKKILAVAALALFAVPAFAGQAKQNTGCGLGTVLWQNKADGSVVSQALQATTNNTFGNQTFGITFGTLECSQPGKVAKNEKLNVFVTANIDNLAREVAAGKGETLDAFAELMQVPAAERTAFYRSLRQNFAGVFTSEKVAMADVIDNASAYTTSR